MSFKTPILINAFNRVDTTKKVFDTVRSMRPERLFIAVDGPRDNKLGESKKCNEVKKVFEGVDWDCEVKTLFRDKNMGCHKAIPDAINWFFSFVDEGIILEDDCLPSKSFFRFCEELLERYRNNSKVMMISGDNFLPGNKFSKESYLFSKYAFIWGWATWKRSWNKFDSEMKSYPKFVSSKKIMKWYPNIIERFFWKTAFNNKYFNYSDGWDMKWYYAVAYNKGLSVVPSVNLITNLGFRSDATVTKTFNKKLVMPKRLIKFPLLHPVKIEASRIYDKKVFGKVYLSTVNPRNIITNYITIFKKKVRI
ncbi:MAG: hypothetical protein WAX66_03115 [Patescibacteria group bacterium]